MFYVRLCYDKPEMNDVRKANAEVHRAYFREHTLPVRIISAGPLCADADETDEIGSFMLLEGDSLEVIQAFHDGDPFTSLGIFAEVRIDRLLKKIG